MGLQWIAKAKINGPIKFELYCVWASVQKQHPASRYIRQIHHLLDHIESTRPRYGVIVVGDFNSNAKWDPEHGALSHSAAVVRFGKLGLVSAYHYKHHIEHGSERHPTIYFRKNLRASYHIDYCFVSKGLLRKRFDFRIGNKSKWMGLSDHMPLEIEIANESR
jgi:endonuclease/exonuclease/phosphatase family metal-dependent hydrolase